MHASSNQASTENGEGVIDMRSPHAESLTRRQSVSCLRVCWMKSVSKGDSGHDNA